MKKLYIPYFDRAWNILEADADQVRKPGRFIQYKGWIYGENAFTTYEGAAAWIAKDYGTANKLLAAL